MCPSPSQSVVESDVRLNRERKFKTAAQFAQALASGSLTTPTDTTTLPQQAISSAKSVAVLPFANMSIGAQASIDAFDGADRGAPGRPQRRIDEHRPRVIGGRVDDASDLDVAGHPETLTDRWDNADDERTLGLPRTTEQAMWRHRQRGNRRG